MKVFLFLMAFYAITAKADPVIYKNVVEVSGTKDQLYQRARRWFSENFKDSKEVLTIQDKESGELAGNGAMKFYSSTHWGSDGTKGYIRYRISILVKDGKYKYEITDFVHEGNRLNTLDLSFGLITDSEECPKHLPSQRKRWEDKLWKEIKGDISSHVDEIKSSLESAMQEEKESNW
jgi:hypothetical protein